MSHNVSVSGKNGICFRLYISIKDGFENNLQFDIQISNAYEEYLLPPMAVQVLIENAVKHNEISNRKPLTIHITTDDNGNLSISNDIQPK